VAVNGDSLEPDCVSVVLEGIIVIDDVKDFPTGVCLFFCYTLHTQSGIQQWKAKSHI